VSAQRRTALISVCAAAGLVALKLAVGLQAHSLGLISEAVHSGTDLVAALLTFLAIGVAGRPADVSHQYGHGKAEHLAALAEASFLCLASVLIATRALQRLFGSGTHPAHTGWYVFATIGVVIAVDAARASVSWRTARQTSSAALASNALHFASDLAGSVAVLAGLVLVRAGHPDGDSLAALFVAVLVLAAAARLMRRNVDVLMDRAPAGAELAARAAIAELGPEVELRRLRMRQAGGRQFADVVIGVASSSPVGQAHAAADEVEAALDRALPGSDVVVHVEPRADRDLRERARAAAAAVPGITEIHNLALVEIDGRTELSLHLKLPGDVTLDEAHEAAERLEAAICAAVPEVDAVQTHLEPLTEPSPGREVAGDAAVVERIVLEATGARPRELRFLRTESGLVAFLTLGLEGASTLDDAHARASEIEERIRIEAPEIDDVIVHTEPAAAKPPVRRGRTGGGASREPGGSPDGEAVPPA
jgi:cation diffusion facilitator family transporter